MNSFGDDADQDLPTGYDRVYLNASSRLALPARLAQEVREDIRRRDHAAQETKQQAFRLQQEQAAQNLLKEVRDEAMRTETEVESRLTEIPAQPAQGWYRVLPKWSALMRLANSAAVSWRSAEKDVNERTAALRKALLHSGPDRRLAMRLDWREQADRLETDLPHFAEPIRLVRNSLTLAEFTNRPVRIPPMLLLGPPGVGKTLFSHALAELLAAPRAVIAFDQPTAGNQLLGSDLHYSNTSTGLLFNLVCMGEYANPVVLLDELDKSSTSSTDRDLDPLSQLHGALEPETARRAVDISVNIEFDASQVTYVATANTAHRLGHPLLSRFEVFTILPPRPSEAVGIARAIVAQVIARLGLEGVVSVDGKAAYVLAYLSPRMMLRTVEKAVGAAVAAGQFEVREADLWFALDAGAGGTTLH
jgi:ATP-dependent Lon protease